MAADFSVYYIVLYCIVLCVCAQSCPTVCDPMDCSLPGSSVPGFLQAKILEWVTISYSRGSFRPRDQTQVSGSPTSAGRFFTTSTISFCWCPNAPAPPSPGVNTGQLSACFHSQICMSALCRGHANLLCIVPILVYVLPKLAPVFTLVVCSTRLLLLEK